MSLQNRPQHLEENIMRATRITLPELALVAGTRVVLGAGIGLLLADLLSKDQRKGAGWGLFLVGALSTIPLALEVIGGQRLSASEERQIEAQSEGNEPLKGRFNFAQT
jgi:hypothetical protein